MDSLPKQLIDKIISNFVPYGKEHEIYLDAITRTSTSSAPSRYTDSISSGNFLTYALRPSILTFFGPRAPLDAFPFKFVKSLVVDVELKNCSCHWPLLELSKLNTLELRDSVSRGLIDRYACTDLELLEIYPVDLNDGMFLEETASRAFPSSNHREKAPETRNWGGTQTTLNQVHVIEHFKVDLDILLRYPKKAGIKYAEMDDPGILTMTHFERSIFGITKDYLKVSSTLLRVLEALTGTVRDRFPVLDHLIVESTLKDRLLRGLKKMQPEFLDKGTHPVAVNINGNATISYDDVKMLPRAMRRRSTLTNDEVAELGFGVDYSDFGFDSDGNVLLWYE
ncbi:hypothetical protein K469DRAFT_773068 [Zopfia rhizophila CBS 207.26]|uniref:Uncharacterized protein n=1 Tax=Zopfia rhizophila CBS 207.26 TaxID=1314779 RepID=A0A6A6E7H7_9PEZI|nr:hypothetical protein K469DRAFT_773068 [Zopfia rhizophila CBS 207.26]